MGINEENRQDLINYRIAKANEVYQEAIDVASMSHWTLAVNRLYYSVFHMATALLLSKGEIAKSHKGVMALIMKEYVQSGELSKEEGKLFASLFNMRHTGDYDDLFDWDASQVQPLFAPTKAFLSKLQDLIIPTQEAITIIDKPFL